MRLRTGATRVAKICPGPRVKPSTRGTGRQLDHGRVRIRSWLRRSGMSRSTGARSASITNIGPTVFWPRREPVPGASTPAADSGEDRAAAVGRLRPAALDGDIRAHLGQQLRAWYGNPARDKLPHRLARLLDRVTQVIRARTEPIDQTFVDGVVASIPSLRGFAISLTRNVEHAEDLVQETVLRAISKQDRFEAGTSLQAWLFTILRNNFFSAHRRSMREEEDVDGSHAATMIFIADQEDKVMIQDLEAALRKLPQVHREAIMLVGAEGLSYEEAAQALGCAVGTIKSRVNRARTCLAQQMGFDPREGHRRGVAKPKNAGS
ncbi:MAG TPA: sigma-70 family RNA polymerase sigma factor [Microvirga sp.]|nr:sigma-70 family RNA polymerase sigma factor [Microvirga sp.]